MAHLIDANCFIEPANRYYDFDFCPGYWDWLEQQNRAGEIFSLDKIWDELVGKGDDLSTWTKLKDSSFFLPTDASTLSGVAQIAAWVSTANFKEYAKQNFLAEADPFLIAHALAYGHTVVSHERLIKGETKKIKVPVVCQAFGIPCVSIFDVLKTINPKFVLL